MEKYLSSLHRRRYFDEEFVANILSFLPAKSVAKFKFLNRRLCGLTSGEYFIMLQSRHAEDADAGFFAAYRYGASICFVDELAGIPADALEFLRSTASILSSANGLIIYFDRTVRVPDSIAVFNPVRRTSLTVPQPPDTEPSHDRFVSVCAIVCKEAWSFDYKLVYVQPSAEWGGNMHCKIYDSRGGGWKAGTLVDGAQRRNMRLEEPVVCGSSVFWASTCGAYIRGVDPYIVALDVDPAAAAPSSRIVPLPTEAVAAGSADDYDIRIARWGETGPCLIQYRNMASVFMLWSLEKTKTKTEEGDAAADSWKKIYQVEMEEITTGKWQVGSFTLINRDILVVITLEGRLYGYSLSSRQLKKLGCSVVSPYSALIPYANTLRPCGRDEKNIY